MTLCYRECKYLGITWLCSGSSRNAVIVQEETRLELLRALSVGSAPLWDGWDELELLSPGPVLFPVLSLQCGIVRVWINGKLLQSQELL